MRASVGRTGATVVTLVVAIATSGATTVQTPLPRGCDAELARAASSHASADGYRVRGAKEQWCEGVYVSDPSNDDLKELHPQPIQGRKVETFTRAETVLDSAEADAIDTLKIDWRAPKGTLVHITARQARKQLDRSYQMDAAAATRDDASGDWRWPVDVLRRLASWPVATLSARGLRRPPAVVVQAIAHLDDDRSGDSTFIPVRVGRTTVARGDPARLTLSLGVDDRVDVRGAQLVRLGDSTRTAIRMEPGCPAVDGGDSSGESLVFTICMPRDALPGVYVLGISSSTHGNMNRGRQIRFYYEPL
jgi:hypothetical protein